MFAYYFACRFNTRACVHVSAGVWGVGAGGNEWIYVCIVREIPSTTSGWIHTKSLTSVFLSSLISSGYICTHPTNGKRNWKENHFFLGSPAAVATLRSRRVKKKDNTPIQNEWWMELHAKNARAWQFICAYDLNQNSSSEFSGGFSTCFPPNSIQTLYVSHFASPSAVIRWDELAIYTSIACIYEKY